MTFATFGRAAPSDVASRVASVVSIEKERWTGYPSAIARLAAYVREARPVATLAFGIQPLLVTWAAFRLAGHSGGLGYIEITRPWEAFNKIGWGPRSYVNNWLMQRSLARCDVVTANCSDGVDELRSHFGVSASNSRRVHNLLDFSEFPPGKADYQISESARLVTTTRLVADKGLEDLIDAMARITPRHNVHLTIVGDGPLRASLELRAARRGVTDRISFTGWSNPPFAHITAADLFVFPSHYEGFPNSVLEPMGLRVPVVTSYWGTDARELAGEGAVLGHEPGDVDSLCTQIENALQSQPLRRALAERAYTCAMRYDSRIAAAEYDGLFAELAAIGASRVGASGA